MSYYNLGVLLPSDFGARGGAGAMFWFWSNVRALKRIFIWWLGDMFVRHLVSGTRDLVCCWSGTPIVDSK